MAAHIDRQSIRIIQYLKEKNPDYWRQAQWSTNGLARCIDFLLAGSLSRRFLESGRKTSETADLNSLTRAIRISSSRTTMGKAFYCRGNSLFGGAADVDSAIADLTMAIWCDPTDCWARKDRATIYEMYRASYESGDAGFDLPMTLDGAIEDIEAAVAFFQSLCTESPSHGALVGAEKMLHQCLEIREKLRVQKRAAGER
jgi:hypothetical protein